MSSDLPVKRRDEEMELHEVLPADCPHCGCAYFRAEDDPEMVWDPGRAYEQDCRDHACHCHAAPVIGRRRDQDPVNLL